MIRATHDVAWLGGLALLLAAAPAHAELTLCNRTSYRVQAAIGLEKRANVSTRGWFRVDPGQCLKLIDGALDADMVYVHARTPLDYGSAPIPQMGNAELCIRDGDFAIANARGCPVSQQVRFTAARPSDSLAGPTVNLAEEASYDDAQARLAGIQRLLTIAGYDAYPIDGVQGAKTQSALAKFLTDHKLPANAAAQPEFFDALLAAARDPQGATRGWYCVGAGKCLRPTLSGAPHRLYSYAEAVDGKGRTIRRGDAPLFWGGKVALCTRDGKFELSNHKDCAARGLNSAGFAVIDTGANPSTTVHLKEP
jgi:uncharacterized membrane protein